MENPDLIGISQLVNMSLVKDGIDLNNIEKDMAKLNISHDISASDIVDDYTKQLKNIEAAVGIDLGTVKMPDLRGKKKAKSRSRSRSKSQSSRASITLGSTSSRSSRRSRSSRSSRRSRSSQASSEELSDCDSECECECHYDDGEDCDDHCACPCHDDSSSVSSVKSGRAQRHLQQAVRNLNIIPVPHVAPADKKTVNDMISSITYMLNDMLEKGQITQDQINHLPKVTTSSDYDQVEVVHKIVNRMFSSYNYTSAIEEILMLGATSMEMMFDGQHYLLGKYPINYRGLGNLTGYKLQKSRGLLSEAVTNVAEKYGVAPRSFALLDLALSFITVPVKNAVTPTSGAPNYKL